MDLIIWPWFSLLIYSPAPTVFQSTTRSSASA